ncbi:MAG: branched-chain amino acid transport system permease protein [Janthinobacterium sp.]|jgi:branched-chain amino acid transport system permease protein
MLLQKLDPTLLIICSAFFLPAWLSDATISNLGYCLVWTFAAIGLSAMWGYGGILSFGQTAFFGLAGYAYGVFTINFGAAPGVTWAGVVIALTICMLAAVLLGYMIFYGGIKDVFIGIVTLSVTLVFETFMAQTAGPQWVIGEARLNGFNGMSMMPSLALPGFGGEPILLEGRNFYFMALTMLGFVYLVTRILLNSSFGLTLEAIRENPHRAEMLGIDIRRYQLAIFVFGSTLGGLSGILYTAWGSYITPSSMGLTAAAMPIIWVATGGRKSLPGVIIATLALLILSQELVVQGSQYALVIMGGILLFVVMAAPQGLLPSVAAVLSKLTSRLPGQSARRK